MRGRVGSGVSRAISTKSGQRTANVCYYVRDYEPDHMERSSRFLNAMG